MTLKLHIWPHSSDQMTNIHVSVNELRVLVSTTCHPRSKTAVSVAPQKGPFSHFEYHFILFIHKNPHILALC